MLARPGAGKRILGRIPGVDTPEAARALMGWSILIDRALLPPPEKGEYYLHDLLGLPVRDDAGAVLGTLVDVVPGERDVWVVQTPSGEGYLLASPETVRSVDLDLRVVTVAQGALTTGD